MSLDATGFVGQSSKPCCELTRCWSVLASRCRRSSGPGGCRAGELFVVFVRDHDCL